eukprot:m.47450 g.47450  ORF g.47450 m.47450 type:complete len:486 (-) comp47564_c0_seq3:60-1517(-)
MGGNTSKDSVVHVPATRKAKSMKSKKPIKSPSSPALSRADRPDDTLFSSKAQPLAKSTENILEEPAQPSVILRRHTASSISNRAESLRTQSFSLQGFQPHAAAAVAAAPTASTALPAVQEEVILRPKKASRVVKAPSLAESDQETPLTSEPEVDVAWKMNATFVPTAAPVSEDDELIFPVRPQSMMLFDSSFTLVDLANADGQPLSPTQNASGDANPSPVRPQGPVLRLKRPSASSLDPHADVLLEEDENESSTDTLVNDLQSQLHSFLTDLDTAFIPEPPRPAASISRSVSRDATQPVPSISRSSSRESAASIPSGHVTTSPRRAKPSAAKLTSGPSARTDVTVDALDNLFSSFDSQFQSLIALHDPRTYRKPRNTNDDDSHCAAVPAETPPVDLPDETGPSSAPALNRHTKWMGGLDWLSELQLEESDTDGIIAIPEEMPEQDLRFTIGTAVLDLSSANLRSKGDGAAPARAARPTSVYGFTD